MWFAVAIIGMIGVAGGITLLPGSATKPQPATTAPASPPAMAPSAPAAAPPTHAAAPAQ